MATTPEETKNWTVALAQLLTACTKMVEAITIKIKEKR